MENRGIKFYPLGVLVCNVSKDGQKIHPVCVNILNNEANMDLWLMS